MPVNNFRQNSSYLLQQVGDLMKWGSHREWAIYRFGLTGNENTKFYEAVNNLLGGKGVYFGANLLVK